MGITCDKLVASVQKIRPVCLVAQYCSIFNVKFWCLVLPVCTSNYCFWWYLLRQKNIHD